MADLISTMNDSKWRRLLDAIATVRLPVSIWRFVGDSGSYKIPTPQPSEITTHDGSSGIGDHHACGPFFFRDVEQVKWPANYERNWCRELTPVREEQSLDELSAAIDGCGKFDYERDDSGLTLFAYRRPPTTR